MKVDFFADSESCADTLIPFYKELGEDAGQFFVPPDLSVIMHVAGHGVSPMPLNGHAFGTMRAIVASLGDKP